MLVHGAGCYPVRALLRLWFNSTTLCQLPLTNRASCASIDPEFRSSPLGSKISFERT